MPCIESSRARAWAALSLAALLAACATQAPPPAAPAPSARPLPPSSSALPAPGSARSWNELRLMAARRMVSANPSITYTGTPPDPLLAIPVLEIELNADGSIRTIDVMRHPRQAKDTVQIAVDAVRRAAPFGDVSRLPKPWKFTETFLFDDDRRFKPRALEP